MHQGTDYIMTNESSPGTLFQGAPGDTLHKDKCVFPWDTFEGAPDYIKTNASSPGTLFQGAPGDRKTNGTLFRVHQETDYMKTAGQAFPWDPFQGPPEDRLDKDK